jgi:hypothetical protein
LLKDLEEVEERLGTQRMIIKEHDDENLEFVEEIKDNNGFQLLIRLLKYLIGHAYKTLKQSKLILLIIALILMYMNKDFIKSLLMRILFRLK